MPVLPPNFPSDFSDYFLGVLCDTCQYLHSILPCTFLGQSHILTQPRLCGTRTCDGLEICQACVSGPPQLWRHAHLSFSELWLILELRFREKSDQLRRQRKSERGAWSVKRKRKGTCLLISILKWYYDQNFAFPFLFIFGKQRCWVLTMPTFIWKFEREVRLFWPCFLVLVVRHCSIQKRPDVSKMSWH